MADPIEKPSASCKVFAIPELLEQILMDINIRELLVNAQRVNSTWHSTIKASKKLQQALFCEPVSSVAVHTSRLQPVNEFTAGAVKLARSVQHTGHDELPQFVMASSVVWNPLLEFAFDAVTDSRPRFFGDRGHPERRTNASWRRMFMAQPPVQIVDHGKGIIKLGDIPYYNLTSLESMLPIRVACSRARCANQMQEVLGSESVESDDSFSQRIYAEDIASRSALERIRRSKRRVREDARRSRSIAFAKADY